MDKKPNNQLLFSQYPDVVTVDQASEMLQVSKKTIYKFIKSGEIVGVKRIGKLYRIPTASVRTFFLPSDDLEVQYDS